MNFVEFLKQHKRFSLVTAAKNGFNRKTVSIGAIGPEKYLLAVTDT